MERYKMLSALSTPVREDDLAGQDDRFKGLETQTANIRERLSNVEGRLESSSAQKSPNAILLAVLPILGLAVIGYWGWIGLEVVRQGKAISRLQMMLSPQIIQDASLRPEDPQSAKQAEQLVKAALKQGTRLDPKLMSAAGAKFADASTQTPSAWGAATALLSYASFLNTSAPGLSQLMPVPNATHFEITYNGRIGTGAVTGTSTAPNLPEAHKLGLPDFNDKFKVGPAFFVSRNADAVLDGQFLKSIIFQDSHIIYNGGPLVLQNVYFVNCTFEIKQEARGIEFAKAVFAGSPSVNLNAS